MPGLEKRPKKTGKDLLQTSKEPRTDVTTVRPSTPHVNNIRDNPPAHRDLHPDIHEDEEREQVHCLEREHLADLAVRGGALLLCSLADLRETLCFPSRSARDGV